FNFSEREHIVTSPAQYVVEVPIRLHDHFFYSCSTIAKRLRRSRSGGHPHRSTRVPATLNSRSPCHGIRIDRHNLVFPLLPFPADQPVEIKSYRRLLVFGNGDIYELNAERCGCRSRGLFRFPFITGPPQPECLLGLHAECEAFDHCAWLAI